MDDESFERKLYEQLAYWQKVLYLQDWTVELKVVRQWEMGDPQTLAQCEWYLQRKDAIISLLAPSDIEGLSSRFIGGEEADYDVSLVHELLHLHFAPLQKSDKHDDVAHEQAINALSRALVKLYREHPTETQATNIVSDTTPANGYL